MINQSFNRTDTPTGNPYKLKNELKNSAVYLFYIKLIKQ